MENNSLQSKISDILSNHIDQVWFCEHTLDNSCLSFSFLETLDNLEKNGYTCKGVCLNPSYKEKSGIALVCEDSDFNTVWFHVNDYILYKWARELHRQPPEDVIWDDELIRKYLFSKS